MATASGPFWLERLKQQAIEGKFADVTVRLTLPMPHDDAGFYGFLERGSKRMRGLGGGGGGGGGVVPQWEMVRVVEEIHCKGTILSARSPYFASCLQGEWREAKRRTVDIMLEDEQAVEDSRLMLKLTYGPSYAHDDGALLPRATRMRLAALADAYELTDCVTECITSLANDGAPLEEAVTCLEVVPPQLSHHPAVRMLKLKLITVLADGIEERAEAAVVSGANEGLMTQAADALATCLGPVHLLFDEGPRVNRRRDGGGALSDSFYKRAPLAAHAKALGPQAFEALLKSERLQCETEDEPYYLLCAWLTQSPRSPEYGKHELFAKMGRHIRFAYMGTQYLANVLTVCGWLRDTELLPQAMHAALMHRNAHAPTLAHFSVPYGGGVVNRGAFSGPGGNPTWTIRTKIALADCLGLGPSDYLEGIVGLVGGYPLRMVLIRVDDNSFGPMFDIVMPRTPTTFIDEGGWPARGVAVSMSFRVHGTIYSGEALSWTSGGVCQIAHRSNAVVREGSPFFPGGRMTVEATITFLA